MTNDSNQTPPSQQSENVIADYASGLQQIQMEGNAMAVKKARNALYWAGGLLFLGEMIAMYRTGLGFDPVIFVIALIEAGIFMGLALWTKKKPYTAVITGLIAFIAVLILSAVFSTMEEGSPGLLKALFSGIIIKVIILVNLIRPLKDAKELQDAMNNKI